MIERGPLPRLPHAEELHDALLSMMVLPVAIGWQTWFDELRALRRAFAFTRSGQEFWAAEERRDITGDVLATVRGWMDSMGPVTAADLAARLGLPTDEVHIALATLENEGQVFQGRYRDPKSADVEWCNRRILARIHPAMKRVHKHFEETSHRLRSSH